MGLYFEKNILTSAQKMPTVKETVEPLLPMFALSDISVRINKRYLSQVASELLTSGLDEVVWAAKQIYLAGRKRWPEEFKRPLESKEGPESINSIISKLASERLPNDYSAGDEVSLLEVRPRLEFDLLADSIYPFSNLPLDAIAEEVTDWPYAHKYESLKQAAAQDNSLIRVHYKLDIISDQLTIKQILAVAKPKDFKIQAYTPRFGFAVPQAIEAAGLDDAFNTIFDESLKLYSLIQGAGYDDQAAYATLQGHKARWQMSLNATQLRRLVRDDSTSSWPVVKAISEKVSEAHPILWEIISGRLAVLTESPKKSVNRVKPYHQRHSTKSGRRKRP